ncbi:MAG TPA: Na+ dependent nucleoside transporter N-terminal domain-containing protein, partial [Elusimicrobiales bacterium]|nr:Na+ dependent nucleoside transporter N-terminal domain-containing protein [Elusimicrobiales bacterium]
MSVHQLISFCGMIVLVAIAWVFSKHKKRISWRTVFCASGIQIVFAVLVLKTSYGQWFFKQMNNVIVKLLSFQQEGAVFVFGILGIPPGETGSLGMFFAFQVLTTIIFFSSLMSILYHLGIIQKVVKFFAIIMHKTCRISGAESLSASANIFVGDIEAPLIIKPYVSEMTESELFCVMVGGMATVAGGVMAAYVALLRNYFPDIAGHLLSASVMSAPAAILMAKILIPETQTPKTIGKVTTITKEPS